MAKRITMQDFEALERLAAKNEQVKMRTDLLFALYMSPPSGRRSECCGS